MFNQRQQNKIEMNTKLIMSLSALAVGGSGIVLSFAPELLLDGIDIPVTGSATLLVQVMGGLYLGFGMLNWMAKAGLIGGIYNRPLVIANFTHFLVVALALIKVLTSQQDMPLVVWVAGLLYGVFALLFGIIMFRHPLKAESKD